MSAGPRPSNKNRMVPVPARGGSVKVPEAPDHFTDEMKQLWEAIWQGGGGFYVDSDAMSIGRYVELTARRRQLLDTAETEGYLVAGSMGQPVAHPALKLAAETEVLIGRLECLLGLNPSDRVRLGISILEQQSALDSFFDKKRAVVQGAIDAEANDESAQE